jgi:hypothetical protein
VPSQQLEDRAPGRVTEQTQAGVSVSVHERLGYTYQLRGASGMMGDDPDRMMGSMMAGAASEYVSEQEARTLGDQPPKEATVDRAAKRITFHSDTVHLTVLGSPEGGPEMAFRIAGLSNPILVPPGARVDLEFINGDPDTSHAWELARGQGTYAGSRSALARPQTHSETCGLPPRPTPSPTSPSAAETVRPPDREQRPSRRSLTTPVQPPGWYVRISSTVPLEHRLPVAGPGD